MGKRMVGLVLRNHCIAFCIFLAVIPLLCKGFKFLKSNKIHRNNKISIKKARQHPWIRGALDKTTDIHGGSNFLDPEQNSTTSNQNSLPAHSVATINSNTSLLHNIYNLFTSTESFFSRWVSPFATDPDIVNLIAKVCSCAFWTYVTMCILGTVGIDTKPFLTFLNVALITLGFAAKDLITHSFAGIFILFNRPFSRGDLVRIGGFRGHVISIDIRYVKLSEPSDGSEILIPLSMVYNGPIVIEKHGNKFS